MALTVRALVAQRDLGVRVLAGAGAHEQPITWVHVSELDDPTPFLSGGELLLTTGLFVRPATDFSAYVGRLGAAGVLGLGFGVGLSCADVPVDLVTAAERIGLPLLEVPRRTPFIALSRAVSRALAADEYAAVSRTFTAQQELTRAALSPDSPARLIRLLARKIDGWAVLLDGRGAALALGGGRAAAMVPAVAVEAARLREHRGSVGAGFEVDGEAVSLQPVGAGARRRAFLAVGRPGPLPPADRHLVNAAVMLLTLGLEQHSVPDASGAVQAAALELALEGHPDLAKSIATRIGLEWPDAPLVVLLALPSPSGAPRPRASSPRAPSPRPLPSRAPLSGADQLRPRGSTNPEWDGWDGSERLQPRGSAAGDGPDRETGGGPDAGPDIDVPVWSAELDGELIAVVSAEVAERLAADLATTGRTVGWSAPTPAAGLPAARQQARHAAEAAVGRGLPSLGFDAVGAAGIAGVWDPLRAAAFSESLLAPLVEHDRTRRGELVASLRAWLAHHGQWDPTAAALGVHRHTLRRRMTLAAELLGRDLDSPTVRSELWLALETMGAPSGIGPARDGNET
jgi:purine catabolism regulator